MHADPVFGLSTYCTGQIDPPLDLHETWPRVPDHRQIGTRFRRTPIPHRLLYSVLRKSTVPFHSPEIHLGLMEGLHFHKVCLI